MKTGFFVRVKRGDGFEGVDVAMLTDAELTAFFATVPEERARAWASALAAWARDNVFPPPWGTGRNAGFLAEDAAALGFGPLAGQTKTAEPEGAAVEDSSSRTSERGTGQTQDNRPAAAHDVEPGEGTPASSDVSIASEGGPTAIVGSTYTVGRRLVLAVTWNDDAPPIVNERLRGASHTWTVRGVELRSLGRPIKRGDVIGLVVDGDVAAAPGEALDRIDGLVRDHVAPGVELAIDFPSPGPGEGEPHPGDKVAASFEAAMRTTASTIGTEAIAEERRRASEAVPKATAARCFHVDAGKRCTRYLEGSEAERGATVAMLKKRFEHYPEDVFPSPPPGEHGATVDACSARAYRSLLVSLLEELGEAPPAGTADQPFASSVIGDVCHAFGEALAGERYAGRLTREQCEVLGDLLSTAGAQTLYRRGLL